jgi:hypothetical protein
MHEIYTAYYLNQVEGGISDIGDVFMNPYVIQSGRGIGNFLAGLYKHLKPLISSGLHALKKQGIKTGAAVLQDIGKKPMRDILKEQGEIAVNDLTLKGINKLKKLQDGSGLKPQHGIKRKMPNTSNHSQSTTKQKKNLNKRNKRVQSEKQKFDDIFTN